MKGKNHEKIKTYIKGKKGKPFLFAEFKKKIHGYTWYGGNKYKLLIKEKYGLKEFKKEGRLYLQKIPKNNK